MENLVGRAFNFIWKLDLGWHVLDISNELSIHQDALAFPVL